MLELDKDNFEQEVLNAQGFVVVDYWGDGCEPCKALMPDIIELAEEFGDKAKFTKLNTTKARRLAISQKVLGLPTVILYKDGQKLAEVTGKDTTKESVKAILMEHL